MEVFARLTRISIVVLVCHAAIACASAGQELDAALWAGVSKGYPGAAAVIKKPASPPEYSSAGYADIENQRQLDPYDCFHIGSISKVFTAVAVLSLVDQGKLSLEATLPEILSPSLVGPIPYANQVTVRQLLDHSSGIYATNNDPEYIDSMIGDGADPQRIWLPKALIELAYRGVNEPGAPPGEGRHYSDTNYVLLGMIIAELTGDSFKSHIRDSIFRPLGLDQTLFLSDEIASNGEQPPACVQGYLLATDELRSIVDMSPMFQVVQDGTTINGDLLNTTAAAERIDAAAGILSTLPDILRFAEAVFGGELLSKESQVFLMAVSRDLSGVETGTQRHRAMQATMTDFGPVIHKSGDGPGGTTAELAYHPETGIIFVGFTNSFGHFDEAEFLIGTVMEAGVASATE